MTIYASARLPGLDLGEVEAARHRFRMCLMFDRAEAWLYFADTSDLRPLGTVRGMDTNAPRLDLAPGDVGLIPHSQVVADIRNAAVARWRTFEASHRRSMGEHEIATQSHRQR